jgi:hypothetical protein
VGIEILSDTKIIIAIAVVGVFSVIGIIAITIVSRKHHKNHKPTANPKEKAKLDESYEKIAQDDVYHIFSNEFHEELRNKARLDFQKVINENAMFLQQDLRLTTSEINEYLKKEVSGKLQEEFAAYQQSIKDVQQAAVDSIGSTVKAAEEQQVLLTKQIQQEVQARKVQMIESFEQQMTTVVNHYVVQILGEQVALKEQLPYIIRELEAHKEDIKKDMLL